MRTDGKTYFLDKFGVSENMLRRICDEGMKRGGNWCDLFFEDTIYDTLLLRDGSVNSAGHHVDYGCGIRVLSGERTGYAYAETTELPALLKAAGSAAAIADGSCSPGLTAKIATEPVSGIYGMDADWRDSEAREFVGWMEKLDRSIRSRDSRAVSVIVMLSYCVTDVLMYNSNGEISYETRPLATVTCAISFRKGEALESRNVSRSYRRGVEMIDDALLEELAAEAVEGVDEAFDARRPKGGKMPVVMGAGASGILLHEAMGHAFEADFNRKGQSVFADCLGKKICPGGINIVDDATLQWNRGACAWDDEGVPGQKTYMVTDGVLTSYLHDRISAAWYGTAPTGNGRRESFRYYPIPRMRATYMENGNDGSAEDLIASVKHGIYVDRFANGQVKIGEGDFTFYVKSGFLIENGRLTMPVKDLNIIGNGPQALSDIEAVADDLKIDNGTWTCGKEQSVPVSCGMPTVLVNNLTVGGE